MANQDNQTIADASQNLLTQLAVGAERDWGDFSRSVNGQTLLSTNEVSVEQRIKTAFILGNVEGQTSSVAAFLKGGMNAHMLPHRRIVWKSPDELHKHIELGGEMENIVFISELNGECSLMIGTCRRYIPDPELLVEDGLPPESPILHFSAPGIFIINKVLVWVTMGDVLRTFLGK